MALTLEEEKQPEETASPAPPPSEAEAAKEAEAPKEAEYQVKWINFHETLYAVVTQNENGPCPLLAVINVLLLRGQVSLPKGVKVVSEKDLLELVGDCILKLKPKDMVESEQLNYEQIIGDVLDLVQTLPNGLDVNPYFTGARLFEYTPSCAFFDVLGIRLLHGWVVDPEQKQLVELLNGMGYNQVAEKAISSSYDDNAAILQHFLETTASQLTEHGLWELCEELADGEIAVLFRNNHFHTLYKNRNDLYVLATDMGFLTEPFIVWETLNCVDGNSTFVDAEFQDSSVAKKNAAAVEQVSEEADYLFALSIQEEERAEEERRVRAEKERERAARPAGQEAISDQPVQPTVPRATHVPVAEQTVRRHERDDKVCVVM